MVKNPPLTVRFRLFAGGAAALVLAGLALWLARPQAPPPLWELPDFHFPAATSAGPQELSKASLAGRVWIADFVFTHCGGPCPLLTRRFAQWQKSLPAGVLFVSFSVDPDRDGVEVLGEYARRFGADPARWFFVTGARDDLALLFIKGFKLPIQYDPLAPSGERVAHSTRFVLVDKRGRVREFFDYEDPELDGKIGRAVAGLLKE